MFVIWECKFLAVNAAIVSRQGAQNCRPRCLTGAVKPVAETEAWALGVQTKQQNIFKKVGEHKVYNSKLSLLGKKVEESFVCLGDGSFMRVFELVSCPRPTMLNEVRPSDARAQRDRMLCRSVSRKSGSPAHARGRGPHEQPRLQLALEPDCD